MTNRLSFMTKGFVINRLDSLKVVAIMLLPDFFEGEIASPNFVNFSNTGFFSCQ
jgi:hypothetical protein